MKKDYYFVHLLNDYSGSPRVLADLISSLDTEDRKTIITSQHNGFLRKNGLTKQVIIPYHNSTNKFLTLFLFCTAQLFTFITLSTLLLYGRYKGRQQVVISNTLLPFGANISSKLFAHRLFCYVHETSVSPKYLGLFLTQVVKYCADELVFVSHYVRDFHAGWSRGMRSHVVYNCVPTGFSKPSMPSESFLHTKFVSQSILFVGSLKLYKGIDSFIALAETLPEYNFTAVLNANLIDYEEFVALHSGIPNITFLYRPKDLPGIYDKHSVLLNLSKPKQWTETFGLTLIEAMACATPVIAPNKGGPLEVVENQSGYTVDVTDLDILRTQIKDLLNSELLWMEVAKNAYNQSKKFTKVKYTRQIVSIFS
ncbi:glycosyltransferase family 4 protein [Vibrio breoganii]